MVDLTQWTDAEAVAALASELTLASEPGFYLILNTRNETLSLRSRGVELQLFALSDAVIAASGEIPEDWKTRVWRVERWQPERLRVAEISDDSEAGHEPIPPTPDEAYPSPRTWSVRFADGLSLFVSAQKDTDDNPEAPGTRATRGRLAVHVVLPADESARLYRALPSEIPFLFMP